MDQNTCPFTVYPFDKYSTKDLTPEEYKNGVYYITYETKEIESCIDIEFLLPDGTIASNTYFDYWRTARYVIDEVQKNGADYLGIAVYHRNLV